jgi:DNA repair protein RadC
MIDELEWKTRRDRINTKLKALNPAWKLVKHRPGLETSALDRHAVEEFPTANGPTDVLPLVRHYADRKQEHFICISINGANEFITTRVVSVGLVNKTQVHPREVFADPITDRASAIIVAHNHPSGGLLPSQEDLEITKQLTSAGEVLGIKVLDHMIFNDKGYYSLLEKGEI